MTTTVFFSPAGFTRQAVGLVLGRSLAALAHGHGDLEPVGPQGLGGDGIALLPGHLLEILYGDFIVHQGFHGAGTAQVPNGVLGFDDGDGAGVADGIDLNHESSSNSGILLRND